MSVYPEPYVEEQKPIQYLMRPGFWLAMLGWFVAVYLIAMWLF